MSWLSVGNDRCLRCGAGTIDKANFMECPTCQAQWYSEAEAEGTELRWEMAYVFKDFKGNWIWREVPMGCLAIFNEEVVS